MEGGNVQVSLRYRGGGDVLCHPALSPGDGVKVPQSPLGTRELPGGA